jgi:hypothetical protein
MSCKRSAPASIFLPKNCAGHVKLAMLAPMRSLLPALLAIVICSPAAFAMESTDSTGNRTVETRFVAFTDEQVQLKRENGRTVTIPVDRLSDVGGEFAPLQKPAVLQLTIQAAKAAPPKRPSISPGTGR